MIVFFISFIKELLSTINTKLYIANKDVLASFGCCITAFIGEMKASFVLGIPLTKHLIFKALYSSLAIFLASMIAIPIFKRLKVNGNNPYEFIVRFRDIKVCSEINNQLIDKGIKTYYKDNEKKLIIDSKNRNQSKIIEEIIYGKYKSLKINELKGYVRIKNKE